MKFVLPAILIAGFLAIGQFVASVPAEAQVAKECRAKYGIGFKERANASEQRRKDSEQRIAACIKSGGKS